MGWGLGWCLEKHNHHRICPIEHTAGHISIHQPSVVYPSPWWSIINLLWSCAKMLHLPQHSLAAWFPSQRPLQKAAGAPGIPRPSRTSWAAKPSTGLEGSQQSSRSVRRTPAETWTKIRLTWTQKTSWGEWWPHPILYHINKLYSRYIESSTRTWSYWIIPWCWNHQLIFVVFFCPAAQCTMCQKLASSLRVHETS